MSHVSSSSFLFQVSISCIFLSTIGCSGPRPILYPNDHLKQVGAAQADQDIEECQQFAEEHVAENDAATVAGNTVVGAGSGGAIGAVGGAVRGGAGIGAAIGAATGAVFGLIRGLFQSSQLTPAYRSFVNRCLAERGYDSVGWN